MKTSSTQPRRMPPSELTRVIEPLVSYICASERPRASLRTALAALLAEVKQTNSAARVHVMDRHTELLSLVA